MPFAVLADVFKRGIAVNWSYRSISIKNIKSDSMALFLHFNNESHIQEAMACEAERRQTP